MKPLKTLKDASKDLNLAYEKQDWGIINSEPSRLKEFIHYFHQNFPVGDPTFKYYMFELIVASFNDILVQCKATSKDISIFTTFVKKHQSDKVYKTIFCYWASIKEEKEFPVGYFLEKLPIGLRTRDVIPW